MVVVVVEVEVVDVVDVIGAVVETVGRVVVVVDVVVVVAIAATSSRAFLKYGPEHARFAAPTPVRLILTISPLREVVTVNLTSPDDETFDSLSSLSVTS
jgi:hypothetical protein